MGHGHEGADGLIYPVVEHFGLYVGELALGSLAS